MWVEYQVIHICSINAVFYLQNDLILFLKKYCYYRDKILDRGRFFPANTASQLKTTNQVRGERRVL